MQFVGDVGFAKGDAETQRIHRHDDERHTQKKQLVGPPEYGWVAEIGCGHCDPLKIPPAA